MRRQTRVKYTFGGDDASGWLPPGASPPQRTPEHTVMLDVTLEAIEDGYILAWHGPAPEYSGDNWYADLSSAEAAAQELFGVRAGDWAHAG